MADLTVRLDFLVTPEQAALLCGVMTGTIYQWVHCGYLPVAERIGVRQYMLNLVDVARAEQFTRSGDDPERVLRDLSGWRLQADPDFDMTIAWVAATERAAQTPIKRASVVYYVRFADRIKIGTTANLIRRLSDIAHDELLATEPGGRTVEGLRHRQFAEFHICREWFSPAPQLMEHIASLAAGEQPLPLAPDSTLSVSSEQHAPVPAQSSCDRAFLIPGGGDGLDEPRQWAGILCEACEPRATLGDGRICRACAARLGEVKPDTLSSWVTRKYVRDVRYEGRRPLFMPAEIIAVAHGLHKREKARFEFLAANVPDFDEAVA